MTKQERQRQRQEVGSQIKDVKYYNVNNLFTACLLLGENNTVLARGVAICSPLDTFNESKGRNRAIGMALKAVMTMCTDEPIRPEVRDDSALFQTDGGDIPLYGPVFEASKHFQFRSEFLPDLTEFELNTFG